MVERAVSPVIGVILIVTIAIILSAVVGVFVLGLSDSTDTTPQAATSVGDFTADNAEQTVRITHEGGDVAVVNEIEVIVTASGPDLDTQARLVNLPASGQSIDRENIDGNEELIGKSSGAFDRPAPQVVVDADGDMWMSGQTLQFRVNSEQADFSDGGSPQADQLRVQIIHTPSDGVLVDEVILS